MRTRIRDQREIDDIASHIARSHDLDDFDKVRVALELVRGLPVRPEVATYLQEAVQERLRSLRNPPNPPNYRPDGKLEVD